MTHPGLYNELNKTLRGDNYDFDLNYKLLISSPDFPLGGGLLFTLKSALISGSSSSLVAALAPYVSISMSGVLWNLFVHYDFGQAYLQNYLGGLRFVLSVSTRF